MPQLTQEQDRQLATTPTEELLDLEILQPGNIRDTLHAYQLAKRCNEKRVMYECVRWGERGARLNDIAPGIIVTPLAIDEFNGPPWRLLQEHVRQVPGGTSRGGRRGGQRGRASDERQGRIHHGLYLPDGRRRDGQLLLRPAPAPELKAQYFELETETGKDSYPQITEM